MTPAHPPDAVVTDPIQQALAAVDGPVPTRAHREMAITIYWAQPDYREIPCGNDYVERGNMRGIDPRVQRFALALATIEHKARREAERTERERCVHLLAGLKHFSRMFDDDAYRVFFNAMENGGSVGVCDWCSGENIGFPCGYCKRTRLEAKLPSPPPGGASDD